jgi:hypothetical protein
MRRLATGLGLAAAGWLTAVSFTPSASARGPAVPADSEAGSSIPPAGDFVHTPAPEQRANTPLPVYAEASGVQVTRVFAKYKGAAMKDWGRVELNRLGAGWGGLIPCADVTIGPMRYWVQGFDRTGEPSASSGDPKHPFVVPIRDRTTSEAPRLPAKNAPQSCDDEGDEPGAGDTSPARADARRASKAPVGTPDFARWWIGVSGALDFLSLPAGADLCGVTSSGVPANSSGYYCTNPDGSDLPGRGASSKSLALVAGKAGQVGGGLQPGDVRAVIAADYALSPELLLGVRFGTILNSYPAEGAAVTDRRAFGPKVHVEARVTYVVGDAPLAHEGFAPMVFAAAGISEFDGHTASVVTLKTASGTTVNQPVNVWRTDGPWFLAAGGGFRYQFSQRVALQGTVRANVALGGVGALFTFGPEIGLQYGF